ncbi:hypothetical protein GGX14DRAFT_543966 [Mycena pura]|uniref:Uncharacterized protein n=1 Tax=Mycena pura TaxID=153505 RepID=A0AAD6V863_9AGAR|nr:hypothetical protein GGX14DRAFT_543966 [Mycena pura]
MPKPSRKVIVEVVKRRPASSSNAQPSQKSTIAIQKSMKHSRQDRAKCRLLYKAGVSAHDLRREFGGVRETISRVIKNDYTVKDNEDHDLDYVQQDPTFLTRLARLNLAEPKREKVGATVKCRKPSPQRDGEVKKEAGSHNPTKTLTSQQAGRTPGNPIMIEEDEEEVHEPNDFLFNFLVQISLKKLYIPLKKIGIDKDGLYRMARYDEERLDAFMTKVGKLVPEMTPFECLALSEEVRKFAQRAS